MKTKIKKLFILLLCICMIIQPFSLKSDITVQAEEANTTLNLMDGSITVTNQSYVQKTSSGTIVSEGPIIGELVLIGIQASGMQLTLNGTNLPTVHFNNSHLVNYMQGTATGVLNVIIEGNCSFGNRMFYDSGSNTLSTLSGVNVTGVTGNSITGIADIYMGNSLVTLTLDELNFDDSSKTVSLNIKGPINVNNCTSKYVSFSASTTGCDELVTVTNSEFQEFKLSTTKAFIDNVTSRGGYGSIYVTRSSPSDYFTMQNSNLYSESVNIGTELNKITNSTLRLGKSYLKFYYTTVLKGSTVITSNAAESYNWYLYTSPTLVFDDSSVICAGDITSNKRFYSSNAKSVIDPINSKNELLYLNKVKVPGASDSYVTVSIDGRDEVNLGTDTDGYLHLYLPTGEHTVRVIDINGNIYEKTFEAISTRETVSNPNIVGELEPTREPANIKTPYQNADIQYSFDNSNWNNAVTDKEGYFKAIIPEHAVRIYIKLVETGENKYADITDGTIGIWENAKPIITAQSGSPINLLKESAGTLYVEAEPFYQGNTLTYKWIKDGNVISDAVNRILNIPKVGEADAGTYTCIVTESDGKIATSQPIIVTVADPDGNAAELQRQIEELTNQVNDLKEQLNNANTDKAELGDIISQLQQKITELQNQVAALQDRVSELEDKLDQAGADKDELNTLIITLNGQITILNQTKENLLKELEQVNSEKANLQITVNNLQIEVNNLTNQLKSLNDQLAELDEENTGLKNQIIILTNQITALHTDINNLEQNILVLNKNNEELQKQLNSANETITHLISIIDLVKVELGVSEDEDILGAIQILKQHLQDTLNQNNQLVKQINDLEIKLNDVTKDNEALKEKLEELIQLVGAKDSDDLLSKIKELQNIIKSSNEQINKLNQEKEQLDQQLEDAWKNIAQLQAQLDALLNSGDTEEELRKLIIDLTAQVQQLQSKNDSLMESVTDLNSQINDLTNEKVKLESEIARLESLLATANSTIEELRQLLADSSAEKAKQESENHSLKEENTQLKQENESLIEENKQQKQDIESLQEENNKIKQENETLKEKISNGGSSGNELGDLKEQLNKVNQELDKVKKELEEAKKNKHTSGSSTPTVSIPNDSVVISPAEDTEVTSIVNKDETNPISGGKIVADEGWEIAQSPEDEFKSSLDLDMDSYVGIYSFYDKSMNSNKSMNGGIKGKTGLSGISANKTQVLSVGAGGGIQALTTDQNGYVKYTFYARRTIKPEQVYECSLDIKKTDYLSPISSLTSSVKGLRNNYSETNTYNIAVKGAITFTVDANFGSYGRKEILYQLVPAEVDFDPDGNWKEVKGNKINIEEVTKAERLYIKYVDNGNNYTVDKTVGFKPVKKIEKPVPVKEENIIPVFEMNKTIYKGYQYQVQFANSEDSVINFRSSDNKVAKVNKQGVITAVAKGKAVITGTVKLNKNIYQYVLNIAVTDGKGEPTLNLLRPDISYTGDTPVLLMYKQIKKNAQTRLEISSIKKDALVSYMTSDSRIVTVTKDGILKGIQKGSADITALVMQDGKQYVYLVKVRVDDGTKDEEMYEYLK